MPTTKLFKYILTAFLVMLLAIGIYDRFQNMDWSQGANLHPDEYGLTNTLTQLHFPQNLADYFNTRISPLSPYQRYNASGQAIGDGPDNRLRWGQWPIILIRGLGELTGNTGYDEIRMLGRYFSATVDTLSVLLILLIGWELYGYWVGLLAGALSSLAVMQIQQAHYMTVDTFSAFFTVLAMYCAVKVAKRPPLVIPGDGAAEGYVPYRLNWRSGRWFAAFGISFGMALASKINLLPLAGMIVVAAFISVADFKLRARPDLSRIVAVTFGFLLLAGVASVITFRLVQPMSFRATQGDTTLLTINLNPDWVDSMNVAQQESSGIGGGPPSEQWASRPLILFPLMNMVVWGMGVPLGVAAWAGCLAAIWQMLRRGRGWRAHLLPVVWVSGYFLFMGTRFVSSLRYFLPLYPFLCLLAAWGLVEIAQTLRRPEGEALPRRGFGRTLKAIGAAGALLVVVGGTFAWASMFTSTVYGQDHTRIQASKWIYQNIPAPFQLNLAAGAETPFIQISAPDGLSLSQGMPFQQEFTPLSDGSLASFVIPHILNAGSGPALLTLRISTDPDGALPVDEAQVQVPETPNSARGVEVQGQFKGAALKKGERYYLTVSSPAQGSAFMVFRNIVANESWDEGLPVRFFGYDPFSQFYDGLSMEVRWGDDANKRSMYLTNLAQVDYIILPSQRSIWSISRFPLTYPMTIEYYRALFDGRLGFDLAAVFQAPFQLGPLWVSDLAGQVSWNQPPVLPRFNFNFFAAEEAFSVYDHPPVWIFKKGANFQIQAAAQVLDSVDLSKVIVQGPTNATTYPIQ